MTPVLVPDPSVLAELAALKVAYIESVPGRIRELEAAIADAARGAGDDAARIERARVLAHRLRGTTGSYGLPDVGARLALVEDALISARDGRTTPVVEPALREALGCAEAAIDRLRSSNNHGGQS